MKHGKIDFFTRTYAHFWTPFKRIYIIILWLWFQIFSVLLGIRLWLIVVSLCLEDVCNFSFSHWIIRSLQRIWAWFELTYHYSGNGMHFSFFTIEFFPLTQKITIPMKVLCFLNRGTKTKYFLVVNIKNNFTRWVSHFY